MNDPQQMKLVIVYTGFVFLSKERPIMTKPIVRYAFGDPRDFFQIADGELDNGDPLQVLDVLSALARAGVIELHTADITDADFDDYPQTWDEIRDLERNIADS
jgi:hypothetical protein